VQTKHKNEDEPSPRTSASNTEGWPVFTRLWPATGRPTSRAGHMQVSKHALSPPWCSSPRSSWRRATPTDPGLPRFRPRHELHRQVLRPRAPLRPTPPRLPPVDAAWQHPLPDRGHDVRDICNCASLKDEFRSFVIMQFGFTNLLFSNIVSYCNAFSPFPFSG
jgi:hypothetical protein